VFLASDLAREVLLALTGPHNYDDAAPDYSRSARSCLCPEAEDSGSESRRFRDQGGAAGW
jgi:hypothetical protein